MALEIPKDPKIYTTVYDGFKGVDYTNDATNVYRKRSPSARNMKPALDGKPYKREGWHIEKDIFDFYDAGGLTPVRSYIDLEHYTLRPQYAPPTGMTRATTYGENYAKSTFTCNYTGNRPVDAFHLMPLNVTGKDITLFFQFQRTTGNSSINNTKVEIINKDSDVRTVSVPLHSAQTSASVVIHLGDDERLRFVKTEITVPQSGGATCSLTVRASIDEYSLVINRLNYFELNGIEHILIFTDKGLFIYNENNEYESNFTLLTTDADCIDSYERAFFFEGDGKSAFYIYGNYKIWSYGYDNGFVFKEEVPYIPLIRIATTPDGSSGAVNENVNMFGSLVYEAYQNNILTNTVEITSVGLDNLELSNEFYKKIPNNGTYVFTFSGGVWTYGGSEVNIYDYGINFTGEPTDGYTITVRTNSTFAIKVNKVINTVNLDDIEVMVSTSKEFDTPLTVKNSGTPSSGEVLVTAGEEDTTFTFTRAYMPLVDGEDAIRVMYKRETVNVEVVTTTSKTVTVTSSFIGG